MSDSSRASLAFIVEGTFNGTPGAVPTGAPIRFVSDSIGHKNATAVSDEIRPDRMRSDLMLLGTNVEGNIDFEFSMNTYDEFIEAALGGTWSSAGVLAGNVKNGVVQRSFKIERAYNDVAQFFLFYGMAVEEFNLEIAANAVIKGNFGFMGARAVRSTTSLFGSVSNANSSTPMVSGPLITGIATNTDMSGISVRSLRFSVKNNLRAQDTITSLATSGFGQGPQDVTGQMEVYFKNGLIYDRFLNNQGMGSFAFTIGDPGSTKTYTITFHKMKLPEVGQDVPGVEADVIQTIGFRALYESTANAQITIARTT